MTNRDRYILKVNEYDLMMKISENAHICPIHAIKGLSPEEKIQRCYKYMKDGCDKCIQSWLNEEE